MLNYKKTTTMEYLNEYPEAFKWLESKTNGLRANVSRYSRYIDYVKDVSLTPKNPKKIIYPEDVFQKGNTSLIEIINLVRIYRAFKDENSNGFINRLKEMVSGADFYNNVSTDDKPRNFQYELLVAEKMKSLGYSINFDELTDVVATRGNDTIYIECKRIKSSKGLESNYRKACKQLININKDAYKFVFIDVFNCYFNNIKTYEYANLFHLIATTNYNYQNFYKSNEKIINSILNEYEKTISGVALTSIGILWLSNVEPQYYEDIKMRLPETMSDEQEAAINILFNCNKQKKEI